MESQQALIAPLERECPLKKYVWMIRESNKSSSDAGPELAGREGHAAMESPQALIAPLERGCPLKKYVWMIREFNKSSSDDRPGPGICDSKYVEDAKAARSVRVWDRVPIIE